MPIALENMYQSRTLPSFGEIITEIIVKYGRSEDVINA